MTLEEAITTACARVGIVPPKGRIELRKWIKADTGTRNGKGDGRVICDEDRATAMNWQTGDSVTVWLRENRTPEEKRQYRQRRQDDERKARERARRAADTARALVGAAMAGQHPYLASKGFPDEMVLVVSAADVERIAGDYLVPDNQNTAIVIPARIKNDIASAQLIWPNGTKKFLYGGEMGSAYHRIASGERAWLCEGYATALSLRAALRGLNRRDTVLVCFSASNIVKVASAVGAHFVAADNDAPPPAKPDQFDGLGAGEFFARKAGLPYLMPPKVGTDINDLHQTSGIFAVQRLITGLLRGVPP